MKKLLWVILLLLVLVPTAFSKNLCKGFEKGEFSGGIEKFYDFNSEIYFTFGYALSNRYEFGLGYLAGRDYNKANVIDLNINFHFFPKRKFDLSFGIGPSYCTENYSFHYSIDDTLLLNPTNPKTETAKYLGGMSTLGINFYPFKNISLDLDYKIHLLAEISEYGNGSISRGGPFFGIKYIF